MRPNILLIHWHDIGRHLSCYGAESVDSPAVDALAADGLRHDQAFSTAPLCSPARGSLFTGRYPHANGLMGLAHLGWEYHPEERTLPALLSESGYDTALVGLQHETATSSRLGFDEVHSARRPNGAYDCEDVTERSLAWLRRHASAESPFFLTVGFWEVHRPYPAEVYPPDDPDTVVPPPILPDNETVRTDFAHLQGSVRRVDRALGRILGELERLGLTETTWVIFTTDHGLAVPGAKGTLSDAGTGVALVQRLPRELGARRGTSSELISHVDLVPTVLEIAAAPPQPTVQGVSHATWLTEDGLAPRSEVFTEKNFHGAYDPMRAIRTSRHKLIESSEERPHWVLSRDIEISGSRRGMGDEHLRHRPPVQFYDLSEDPLETTNLVDNPDTRQTLRELRARILAWQTETGDPLLHGPLATPTIS